MSHTGVTMPVEVGHCSEACPAWGCIYNAAGPAAHRSSLGSSSPGDWCREVFGVRDPTVAGFSCARTAFELCRRASIGSREVLKPNKQSQSQLQGDAALSDDRPPPPCAELSFSHDGSSCSPACRTGSRRPPYGLTPRTDSAVVQFVAIARWAADSDTWPSETPALSRSSTPSLALMP